MPPKPSRTKPVPPQPRNHRLWAIRNATANSVATIELFGDIGASREGDPYWGTEGGAGTFQEFANELKAIGNVPELRVEIHSYGGDVVVGKGIYDKLIEHPANKTAVIYGMCASAATYAAMACQKIVMSANSFMVIHNSITICWGNASDLRRAADGLEIIDQSIANLYAARTGMPVDEIRQIMDQDTWMTGDEALAMGLADEVTDPIAITPDKQAAATNFLPRVMNTMPRAALPWFDSKSLLHPANHIATPAMSQPATPPAPAAAPEPAAPAPAVANTAAPQAPATPAVAAEPALAPAAAPAPAPSAPVNASPSLADITAAISNELAPLKQRLEIIENQQRAGITPANLAGAQPAPIATSTAEGSRPSNQAITPRERTINALAALPVFATK